MPPPHVSGVRTTRLAPEDGKIQSRPDPLTRYQDTLAAYEKYAHALADQQWDPAVDFGAYLDEFSSVVHGGGRWVIDAGCGAGRDVAALASRGLRCVGVDISAEMLALATQRVRLPTVEWIRADIRDIPIRDGGACGIWANASLLHLDPAGRRAALREFRRLLQQGDPVFLSTLDGVGVSSRTTGAGNKRWFWATSDNELRAELRAAGFEIVWARTEPGIVRGRWVNSLAVAA